MLVLEDTLIEKLRSLAIEVVNVCDDILILRGKAICRTIPDKETRRRIRRFLEARTE